MKKYHFVFDNTQKNKRLKKILLKKYKNSLPNLSYAIIVLGGDGAIEEGSFHESLLMLKSL